MKHANHLNRSLPFRWSDPSTHEVNRTVRSPRRDDSIALRFPGGGVVTDGREGDGGGSEEGGVEHDDDDGDDDN